MQDEPSASGEGWDVFVSYASEDREAFVRPLHNALRARGLKVWIDYGEVMIGDSVRQSLDSGLLQSNFAVVVLSEYSLTKFWTSNEIDGLFALEAVDRRRRILPVLHRITHEQVVQRSPLLAGRLHASSHDFNDIVEAIARVVQRHATPAARSSVTVESVATPIYNMPQRLPSFVGRTDDLARLKRALDNSNVALTTSISGLAGIGKTALATELGHRLAQQGDFPGGIYWLPAEQPDLSLTWATDPLGGRVAPDVAPKERAAETLRRLSRTPARLLVILDNVAAWDQDRRPRPLPEGEHVHLLVTTRERNLGGTQLDQFVLGVLPPKDAHALLLQTAGRPIEPGVGELLEHLAGHALAIELAGAYLCEFREESARDYLHASLSGVAPEDSVPRDRTRYEHTTLHAMDALWARLDADTRRAWCLAAAFADDPASFGLSDLAGLDSAARARLHRFHLIDISVAGQQWQAHRLVRAYGRSRPSEADRRQAEVAFISACAKLASIFDLASGYKPYLASRAHIDRATQLDSACLVLEAPALADFVDHVGTALHSAGEFLLARKQHERALALDLSTFGEQHPTVASRRCNLGTVLRDLGDAVSAREQLQRALDAGLRSLGADHHEVAVRRSNLGQVLQDLGDLAGARVQLELALELGLKAHGEHHPVVANRRSNLGLLFREDGDPKAARKQFEAALASDLLNFGEDHPSVATRRSNYGLVLQDLGDHVGARVQFERAIAIDVAALGRDHPNVAIRRSNLGRLLGDIGDVLGARREGCEALRIARLLPSGSRVRSRAEQLWKHLEC